MSSTWTDSIVAVVSGGSRLGSAFFAKSTLAVTCAHVVAPAMYTTGGEVALRTTAGRIITGHIDIADFDQDRDLALIRLEAPPDIVPLCIAPESAIPFVSFGFPRTEYEGIFNSGEAHGRVRRSNDMRFRLDITLERPAHGFSGAPLVDVNRRVVIGIISEAVTLSGTVGAPGVASFAIPSSDVLDRFSTLRVQARNPFLGLRAYSDSDAPFYAGHQAEVTRIIRSIASGTRLMIVTGPSGCGKSSLLKAGVVPQVAKMTDSAGNAYNPVIIRPSTARPPLEVRQSGLSTILVIDQAEEAFISLVNESSRAFSDELRRLAETSDHQIVILCRDDYFFRWTSEISTWAIMQPLQVVVELARLDRSQVQEIVCKPPAALNVVVDPSVADVIFRDALREERAGVSSLPASVLPLISLTLTHMWEASENGGLSNSEFPSEGIGAMLADLAENALGRLSDEDRKVARVLLLTLVAAAPDGDVRRFVRRRLPRKRLVELLGASAERLGYYLATERVLTTSRDPASGEVLELAHDILVDKWSTMHSWLEATGEDVKLRDILEKGALEWDNRKKDSRLLLQGPQVRSAIELLKRGDVAMSPRGSEFVRESSWRSSAARLMSLLPLIGGVLVFALLIVVAVPGLRLSAFHAIHRMTLSGAADASTREEFLPFHLADLGRPLRDYYACDWYQFFQHGHIIHPSEAITGLDPGRFNRTVFILEDPARGHRSRWFWSTEVQPIADGDHETFGRLWEQAQRAHQKTGFTDSEPEPSMTYFQGWLCCDKTRSPGLQGGMAYFYAKWDLPRFLGPPTGPQFTSSVLIREYQSGYVLAGVGDYAADVDYVYYLFADDANKQSGWFRSAIQKPIFGSRFRLSCIAGQ